MQDSVAANRSFVPVDYFRKVISVSPSNLIGYWPMDEDLGPTAIDYSGRDNDGAYTSVTLSQAGIGDGRTSVLLDGSASFNNVYSAALSSDFDGAEGTIAQWCRVSGAGVWTDATFRRIWQFDVDASNRVIAFRSNVNNRITIAYTAGGTAETRNQDSMSTTDWFHLALTWSSAGDEVIFYLDGTALITNTGLGAFTGAIGIAILGALNTTPSQVWDGFLAHAALWATSLPAAGIAALAVA